MRYKVPKNIDIEDRIIGSLTGKQFLWLLGAAVILFLVYHFVDFSLFVLIGLISFAIAGAFAFYKPYGQNLIEFLANMTLYSSKDREYIWKREYSSAKKQKKETKEEIVIIKKQFPYEKAEVLANILDTEGEAGLKQKNLSLINKSLSKKERKASSKKVARSIPDPNSQNLEKKL